jgi:hypothetical protein
MRSSPKMAVVAVAAFALSIGVAGCGSDKESAPAQETTAQPTATSEAAAPEMTIAEYVQENNIVQTPVRRGSPPPPTIELPVPPGWRGRADRAPADAYDAMVWVPPASATNPALAANPATLIVYVYKLTGNVDAAKVLEYAPAEIQRMPGYEGPKVGGPTKLGGFDAVQIGGSYMKDGVKHAVGQMTAVIPAQDGLYVLQLNADSIVEKERVQAVTTGTGFIATQAKITP